MKEMQAIRLTTEAISPKLSTGRKTMSDGVPASPEKSQPEKQESTKTTRTSSVEKSKAAPSSPGEVAKAWEVHVSQYPKGSEARRLAEEMAAKFVEKGRMPPTFKTSEAARKIEEGARDAHPELADREFVPMKGMAMSPPTPPGTPANYDTEIQDKIDSIDPVVFTDPAIQEVAQRIKRLHGADYLDSKMLQDFYGTLRKYAVDKTGSGTPVPEVLGLQNTIAEIIQLDDLRTGKIDSRDRYAIEITKYEDLKNRLAAATGANKDILQEEVRKLVRKVAGEINLQGPGQFDEVFEMIIEEGNSLEYTVNRIISPPLDSESGDWDLGFYGKNNLDLIINTLRTQRETHPDVATRARRNVQYQSIGEMVESVRLAHEVNKSIVNADLKTFSAIAGSLDDGKLTRLGKVTGVGIVGRLLEAEYGSLLARDGWVNSQNYSAMMGRVKNPETGVVEIDQEQSAFSSFKELVELARNRLAAGDPNLTNEMRELGQLEDWQVVWAFNIGKSVYNMWLRSAEWISQGQTPKGDKGYVSFPQESIARILNWPQWMLNRFSISESRGGMEWLKMAVAAHQANRGHEGYGEMGLELIGGKKVEEFEMPDMVGVRGWWATWRERQLLMSTLPLKFSPRGAASGAVISRDGIKVNPDEISDLGFLLDEGAIEIQLPGGKAVPLGKADESVQIDYIKSVFLDQNGRIRGDYKRALGASLFFLKPGGHSEAIDKTKEEIRVRLWEEAAKENPLGIISHLNGLKYSGGRQINIVPGPDASPADKLAWRTFERKLFKLNEMKMQRIGSLDKALAGNDPAITRDQAVAMLANISLAGLITEEGSRADGITFDARENAWLETIKTEGEMAAEHLANVRFEYNPFLNDAPLEKVDYSVIGHEGYRRMLNDTSSFQEANNALITMMDNPSKFKEPKEIFEAIAPFVKGVGDILGTNVGQKKGWIWLSSAVGMYERGSNAGSGLEKRIRQFTPVDAVLQMLHRPNSLGQKWAGHQAAVWDSQMLFEAGEEGVHMGVISEEEEKKWRKRFGGRGAIAIQKLIRYLLAGLFVGGIELGKESTKDIEKNN